MADPKDLQAARDALAQTLDTRVAAFREALVTVWRQLDRALVSLVTDAANGSTTAIIRAARAGRLKREIEQALDKAGWADLVDASTSVSLDAVLSDVEAVRLVAEIGAFTATDATRLDALKVLAGTDLLQEGQAVATALWQATVQGVFSSRPVDQILDDLGTLLDKSAPQIRTLYDTSISVFARQAEAVGVSTEADQPFVYTGPADLKTRPFCRAHIGKVYTKAAIDQMENGQLPNVFITAGGFNCRHGWTAVSRFSDLTKLTDTGERVPELSRGMDVGGAQAA